MEQIKITLHLKKNLKEDFVNKVKSDNNYLGISEALNKLILQHIDNSNEDYLENNNIKTLNGFYLNSDVKEKVEYYISHTKQFTNKTELITSIIYNYINDKEKHMTEEEYNKKRAELVKLLENLGLTVLTK